MIAISNALTQRKRRRAADEGELHRRQRVAIILGLSLVAWAPLLALLTTFR